MKTCSFCRRELLPKSLFSHYYGCENCKIWWKYERWTDKLVNLFKSFKKGKRK